MLKSIILLIFLICLNAIFAGAELAVVSMNPSKLKKLASEGDKRAKKLISLTDRPAKFLATIQVAITLAGLLQSAFAADTFAGPLAKALVEMGVAVPEEVLRTAGLVVITMILGYFNLVFGELVPKRVAMKKSEELALALSGMLYTVAKLGAPIVWLLTVSTNGILRLIGINPDEDDEQVTEEEIRMMLTEGSQQGTIREEETEIIKNVFEFNDTPVETLCTHRREIVMLSDKDSDESWLETINSDRHTFYPIYGKSREDIVGILDTRDYFRLEDKSRANVNKRAVVPPFFVPEGMRADVLLAKMKENHSYFAVIIDEYGALEGIITLHDLVEALVGDLNEAEDAAMPAEIEQLSENSWRILGRTPIDEAAEVLGVELPEDMYDTFGGYVCGIIGRIPADGETLSCETDILEIQVLSVKNHVVSAAKVTKKPQTEKE